MNEYEERKIIEKYVEKLGDRIIECQPLKDFIIFVYLSFNIHHGSECRQPTLELATS
jgi:hypothetical protein